MKTYYLKVRCCKCDACFRTDALSSDQYNSSRSMICHKCGEKANFYDSVEYWLSTSTWWKPWTWHKGYWVKIEDEDDK